MRKTILLGLLLQAAIGKAQTNYNLSFNGTSSKVDIGQPLTAGTSFTKTAWVYATDVSGNRNIISSNNSPLWINSGILKSGVGAYDNVVGSATFPTNRWVHVAVTFDDAANTMKLYQDGVLINTNSSVSAAYTQEQIHIGSHNGSSSFYVGTVDEVQLWSTALTQAQLKTHMLKGPSASASGLVSHFKFNDGSGTTLTNSCTNGTPVNGTITDGTWNSNSPVQFSGNAVDFDGSNDYVELTNRLSMGTNNFTFEAWVKPATGSGNYMIFAQDKSGDADDQFRMAWLQATSKAEFNYSGPASANIIQVISSNNSVPVGSWTHIAVVRNGLDYYLYINGVQDGTANSGTSINNQSGAASAKAFRIGSRGNTVNTSGEDVFKGAIDEFRYWSAVRSQAQIQANMNYELDPTTQTNLAGYLTFNQGIASGTNTGLISVVNQNSENNASLKNFALSGSTSNYVTQYSSMIILPVVWRSFTANLQGQNVVLNWSASDDADGDYLIQRSADGRNWSTLSSLASEKYSGNTHRYQYIDKVPTGGANYYRIIWKQAGGKVAYTHVCLVSLSQHTPGFLLASNAVTGTLQLQVFQPGNFAVLSVDGKILMRKKIGAGTHNLDISSLSNGVYWIREDNSTQKFVVR